jgi:glycosyltransferase involved in cell wall biosynthesis
VTRTVLHYSDSTVFGGTERAILHLIAGADRSRWRTVLMHDASAPAELVAEARRSGAETYVGPAVRRKYDVGQLVRLTASIRRLRPDVFHAHLHWPLAAKYGVMAAATVRTPVIVATAQLHIELGRSGFVDSQHRVVTSAVDRYIAVSSHVAAALEQRFSVSPAKITVIPNAVDLRLSDAEDAGPPAGWPQSDGAPVVLILARLEPEKGIELAIEAMTRLPDARLVVAGDGSLRTPLEELARAIGVDDRVYFLGHRADAAALLRHSQVFVLPSLREGLPLSVLEAMAAGVPVVATDIGGTREIVRHEQTGLLVPVDEPAALAAAIQRTLTQRDATAGRVAAARALVQQEYSTDVVVRRVFALYDELLGAKDA